MPKLKEIWFSFVFS